jgi:hypothetical protein
LCPSRHSFIYLIFFYFLQYVILQDSSSLNFFFARVVLPALSKSSALGFLLKFPEGGVPGGGIEPGTAVQQSSALSTKPRCTLLSHAAP